MPVSLFFFFFLAPRQIFVVGEEEEAEEAKAGKTAESDVTALLCFKC